MHYEEGINQGLSDFLQSSPTPFHAVLSMQKRLEENAFSQLEEGAVWALEPNQSYYVIRNGSSIVAFKTGHGNVAEHGFKMLGAHTDSPCLKIKPQPEIYKNSYAQLGVEVYGGALLNPWFDRDLSIAGRVNYLDKAQQIKSCLIDFKRPIAVIPSLAIHLDREANSKRNINAQTYLPPLILQDQGDGKMNFKAELLDFITKTLMLTEADKVLDYELCLYDVQAPSLIGLKGEFFASARLDNLLSCYVGLESLITASNGYQLLVCNDHEEVGSVSAAGANGPFLEAVLQRIVEKLGVSDKDSDKAMSQESFRRMLDKSMMISVDNAHGIHPNFADKHDQNHGPILNKGPVIKLNANQRYASNSETSALFRQLCEREKIPMQSFVVRSDMACGSTIGPIVAAELGLKTLDIGLPTFAMHSIRELAGSKDVAYLHGALTAFYGSD